MIMLYDCNSVLAVNTDILSNNFLGLEQFFGCDLRLDALRKLIQRIHFPLWTLQNQLCIVGESEGEEVGHSN